MSNMFEMNDDLMPSERVLNAASFGQHEALLSALKEKGDPNYVRLDIAPSLICCMRAYDDCLRILMEHGARGDIANRVGWTAFHEASQKEDFSCLEILLSHPEQTVFTVRDSLGETALHAAIVANRFENANALIKASPELLFMRNENGVSPVMWAVTNRKIDWLEWCLLHGADVNQSNERDESAASASHDWPEGKLMIENMKNMVVIAPVKRAIVVNDISEKEDVKEVTTNPFGLGVVKKKAFVN